MAKAAFGECSASCLQDARARGLAVGPAGAVLARRAGSGRHGVLLWRREWLSIIQIQI
ncbi:hypothetical protein ISE1_2423 [plant metagenome]|uniref:Uncharacterized protein n=1 Tax=plant metagenome TaxID=1297885 RepID=A0A484TMT5_9ZZZZ